MPNGPGPSRAVPTRPSGVTPPGGIPSSFCWPRWPSAHMLSYLHACAANGIVVTGYTDDAHGTMTEKAAALHHQAEVIPGA
jgi:hypothetical protein